MEKLAQGLKEATGWVLVVIVTFAVGLALCIGMGIAAVYGHGWFVDHTANRSGKTQVKQKINGNGDYRIAQYDHFYDLCASVQTSEAAIRVTQNELATTTDPQRKAVLQANLGAQQINRSEAINTYNADARKQYTAGQFRASDLPSKLYISTKETSCTAS